MTDNNPTGGTPWAPNPNTIAYNPNNTGAYPTPTPNPSFPSTTTTTTPMTTTPIVGTDVAQLQPPTKKSKSTKGGTTTTKKKTARRKKGNTTTGGGGGGGARGSGGAGGTNAAATAASIASTNAASQAALKAANELATSRADAEARKSDAAWLSPDIIAVASSQTMGEDAANANNNTMVSDVGFLSEENTIVEKALSANGLRRIDVTPQAYGCLLEHARRYACEIVADAQDFAWHCNRREIEGGDLKLAAEMRLGEDYNSGGGSSGNNITSMGFCSGILPPRSQLLNMAEEVNKIPLPCVPDHCYNGIVLPPVEYQLTARTFDVISSARSATNPHVNQNHHNNKNKKNKSTLASYGANKGKQIVVNLKSNNADSTTTAANTVNNSTGGVPPSTTTTNAAGDAAAAVPPQGGTAMVTPVGSSSTSQPSVPSSTTTVPPVDSSASGTAVVGVTNNAIPVSSSMPLTGGTSTNDADLTNKRKADTM